MPRALSRRAFAITTAQLLALGALAACGDTRQSPATPVAATSAPTLVPTVAPTKAPTATPIVAPTAVPTATPLPAPEIISYAAEAGIPIRLDYPAGWRLVDFGDRDDDSGLPERSLVLMSPDADDTALIVRHYDYKEPGSGDVLGAYVAIQFNESIDERTVVDEHTNDDGSIDAEWTYPDPVSGESIRALLRFLHNEGSPYTYALMFRAPEPRFAELAPAGRAIIASFREE